MLPIIKNAPAAARVVAAVVAVNPAVVLGCALAGVAAAVIVNIVRNKAE